MDVTQETGITSEPLKRRQWDRTQGRDWQLWALSLLLIAAFSAVLLGPTLAPLPKWILFGVCLLIVFTLAYLGEKRGRVAAIRRTLLEQREKREEQLLHNAFHDPLTDLPNRTLLIDRLRSSVARARRHKDYIFAVIFIDLDRLKLLNDSMGHQAGDKALAEFGHILKRCLRTEDTVARVGGDEFAVLLDGVREGDGVLHVLERIRGALEKPVLIEEREVFLSCSMGIAVSSTGYDTAEDAIRDADTAMYSAKSRGRAQWAVFDASMHEQAVVLLNLETDLRRAVERQEFALHYQPIIWLSTGEVAGLEALIRWHHPERGLVSPAEFLPVAESVGLMVPITRWVLDEVCRQARAWHQLHPGSWPLSVSANLPAQYLNNQEQVAEIAATIARHGLRPSHIRLEITENQMMDNLESVQEALSQFSTLGTRVYIDDFGTGFSSLAYLSRFQVDALKIDQSFVRHLNGDDRNAAIVRSIVSLGHSLGVDVIAEGIETEHQLSYLRKLRCHYGQGYHFSKPMAPEQVALSLAKWFPEARDKADIAARLRAFEMFSELGNDDILEIAQTCEEALVPARAVLIREGQIGDYAYMLEEGSVSVYRGDGEPLATLEAPAVFGEMALLNPEGVRTASVRALSSLRVLKVPIIQGLSFRRRYPALNRQLQRLSEQRSSPAKLTK